MALLAVTMTAGPSLALELAAVEAQWSPDGGTTQIPIWSFVEVPNAAAFACPGAPAAWNGPEVLNGSPGSLTINVKNCLGVPVSLFIPGLARPVVPQTTTDGQGRERVTSFDKTVAPNGVENYSWTAKEGTYLLQSGTDVRTQVPMGLYGTLIVSGSGYPAVTQDEVLLFSEIDPRLNNDPAGFGGARIYRGMSGGGVDESGWNPQYFLINGEMYPNTADLNINVSDNVLLRFVNAGLDTVVPTLGGGLFMDVYAEDGNLYPYPLKQYGLELTAGKTMDVVVNAGAEGEYAIYDRSLHLTNGGMMTHLVAAAGAGAPTAAADSYTVDEDTLLAANGIAPNPAGVLDNDSVGAAVAVQVNGPSNGILALMADGTFSYSPNLNFNGVDQFTYAANDGLGGPNSIAATVTINVNPINDVPTTVADAYQVAEGTILNVAAPGVLTNDSDIDGDSLTATVVGTVSGLTLNPDGSFTYTPAGTAGAIEQFQYMANDGTANSDTTTVIITVTAAASNADPIANNDVTSVTRGATLNNYSIVANDEDPDGTIDVTSVVITTGGTSQLGGTVTNNGDGTINYTPPRPGFRGSDTFQYTVNDNAGATSNIATVTINVVR